MNTAKIADSRHFRILTTATLLRRFHERCPLGEIYEKAIRSYETLIDAIEKPEITEELSSLLDIPAITIKDYAESIIALLLFNKENDPFLSFGLQKDASFSEVNKRWKSLIVLYHPDKLLNQKTTEEKAKKINELYEKIQNIRDREDYSISFISDRAINLGKKTHIASARYLKYVPSIIIVLAVIIAILSVLLLIFDLEFTKLHGLSNDQQQQKTAISHVHNILLS